MNRNRLLLIGILALGVGALVSYMVYSTAFGTLKPEIRDKLYRRLYDTLKARGADGADAIAILAQTKSGLPDTWK